jgi:hypothetical protein
MFREERLGFQELRPEISVLDASCMRRRSLIPVQRALFIFEINPTGACFDDLLFCREHLELVFVLDHIRRCCNRVVGQAVIRLSCNWL